MVSKVEDKKRDEEITYFEKLIEYNTDGINITVKHELLPEKYLEKTDIDYSVGEVILQ